MAAYVYYFVHKINTNYNTLPPVVAKTKIKFRIKIMLSRSAATRPEELVTRNSSHILCHHKHLGNNFSSCHNRRLTGICKSDRLQDTVLVVLWEPLGT